MYNACEFLLAVVRAYIWRGMLKKCTFVCEGVCVYVWRGMRILCM